MMEVSAMKARIKFSKYGSMKFIGHLDVMRYFQKAFRRSEIEMEYSQGYSPHQLISFAAPLGVGLTSDAEYVDIQISSGDSSPIMVERLNQVMSEGFEIHSFKRLDDDSKNAMSIVAAADYQVSFKDGYDMIANLKEQFEAFYRQEEINILKKTKKSEMMVNIKPYIYHISFEKDEFLKLTNQKRSEKESTAEVYKNSNVVYMQLATGSVTNIKPELVMEAFCQYLNIPFNEYAYQYHRLEVYADMGAEEVRKLISLDELGTEVI